MSTVWVQSNQSLPDWPFGSHKKGGLWNVVRTGRSQQQGGTCNPTRRPPCALGPIHALLQSVLAVVDGTTRLQSGSLSPPCPTIREPLLHQDRPGRPIARSPLLPTLLVCTVRPYCSCVRVAYIIYQIMCSRVVYMYIWRSWGMLARGTCRWTQSILSSIV